MIDRHGSVLAFFLVGEFLVGGKGKKSASPEVHQRSSEFSLSITSTYCSLALDLDLNHTLCEALCWISLSLIIYRSDFSLGFYGTGLCLGVSCVAVTSSFMFPVFHLVNVFQCSRASMFLVSCQPVSRTPAVPC